MDKTARMEALVAQLNQAADAYYNGQGEQMTDHEWDALFDELARLERESGVVLPDSPTARVSADSTPGQKEAHEYAALSLAKTKSVADVARWADGRPIWLSWKLDGLTLVVTYDDGKLTRVVTRGNGHTGTNITHLASAIGGLPQRVKAKGHLVVRGEAVISYEDFEQFNMESNEEYANPRNLASGSLTLKDVDEVARRHLQWIPFTLVHTDEDINSWGARMDYLKAIGLHPVDREAIVEPSEDNVQAAIDRWTLRVTSGKCPFPVDGLVVAYDDWAYALTGSVTGHHATRAGLAFKWQDESAEAELDHIEWSCAASTISPVAVFTPVQLEGTTVRRASLCNISECRRLGVAGPGTKLEVIKANKIIPKVISVVRAEGTFAWPDVCPVCGAPTVITVSETSHTETLHCTNDTCPAKQLRKFVRFVSKEGVNIDGVSEQSLARFINLGWVSEAADLFHLPDHVAEIARLEGFGKRSATKLAESVERARDVEAARLLYALCIPLCGVDVCRRLLGSYQMADLIAAARQATDSDFFAHIDGIGPEKSASFVRWMQAEANIAQLDRLLAELRVTQASAEPQGSRCEGLTFVVTGDVHHYPNRAKLKAYIESQGGKVTGSVSKSTSFLINNDAASTSGKNKKAHELGIAIITEDEFVERFG